MLKLGIGKLSILFKFTTINYALTTFYFNQGCN